MRSVNELTVLSASPTHKGWDVPFFSVIGQVATENQSSRVLSDFVSWNTTFKGRKEITM